MSVVGNDNYKPDMVPPEPIRQNGGWFSTNMAQLMVFVNGLVLTVTAFVTLNIFINEIVKEALTHTSEEIVLEFNQNYRDVKRGFDSLSILLSSVPMTSMKSVRELISDSYSDLSAFNQIYIVDTNGDNKKPQPVFINRGGNSRDADWVNRLDFRKEKESFKIVPRNVDGITVSQPVLYRSIDKQGEDTIQLLALLDFASLMTQPVEDNLSAIHRVTVLNVNTDTDIYNFVNENTALNALGATSYLNVSSVRLLDQELEIQTSLMISSRQAFLQKIPLLMLLFGITLTLIGTLYVRNNQAQSKKLASMNKKLAHKNFELNQEMAERERLTQVVHKSALENRSIINAVSDIIVELSTDGVITFLNDAWVKVTGFDLEQSIGQNVFDLLHSNDQSTERLNFSSFVKGQKDSYRSFAKLRSANGSFRAIELSISMVRYDDSNNLHVVGTIVDVEDRRRAEKALSEAEKKYRAIVENAAGGLYQVTPEGQFLSANPALAKILGYNRPEEVLRQINKAQEQLYVHVSDRESFLNDVKEGKGSRSTESQIKTKDGSVIWVRENVRPVFDDENNLLFFEGSIEDVDQRKIAELALKDAKTESDLANRSKSEFLANMSHELRTPLNSIIGFSDIIKTESYGKIEQSEYLDYANNIHDSGNRLLKVINEILDVSRIESGNRTLNEGVVHITEVVKDALMLVDGKMKEANIRVENKTTTSSHSLIGESHAIKQMLVNLLSNAIKFSPENSLVVMDCDIDGKGRLCLSVSDTGIGLTDDEVEKALSPFGQLESDHNRAHSGTGLGLTLVKSLVDLHGGELDMVSQKGIGTTVTLMFPAQRVSKSEGRAKPVNQSVDTNVKNEDPSLVDE